MWGVTVMFPASGNSMDIDGGRGMMGGKANPHADKGPIVVETDSCSLEMTGVDLGGSA